MYECIEPHFPICCEAYEDYIKNGESFSAQEMNVIKELLENADAKAALARCMANYEGFHLGKREQKEFLWKIEN